VEAPTITLASKLEFNDAKINTIADVLATEAARNPGTVENPIWIKLNIATPANLAAMGHAATDNGNDPLGKLFDALPADVFVAWDFSDSTFSSFAAWGGNSWIIAPVRRNTASLVAVKLQNSISSLPDYIFFRSTNLRSVTLPANLTTIGCTFEGCHKLNNVVIPSTVTSIGNYAFASCPSLTSVYMLKTTPCTLWNRVFTQNSGTDALNTGFHIYVPSTSAQTDYKAATGEWTKYTSVIDVGSP
jgi:hypothetical protein